MDEVSEKFIEFMNKYHKCAKDLVRWENEIDIYEKHLINLKALKQQKWHELRSYNLDYANIFVGGELEWTKQ